MTDARARWDRRYRESAGAVEPASFLLDVADQLPDTGTMVDVAGGAGRNAIWFAERGFDATVVDISEEGLARARAAAEERDVVLECIARDVEAEGLPPGRCWDVALMHLFSHRATLRALPAALHPGGLLLFAQPTTTNLERHDRPSRPFLLEPGELAQLVEAMPDIEVLELSEGWRASGRHEARLVARRS